MIKCWICGAEATRSRDLSISNYRYDEIISTHAVPSKNKRCYCDKCFIDQQERLKQEHKQYIELKHKRMMENALDKLEHQCISFIDYEEAIKAVEEYNLEHLDKFDSSYEIIAAIIFIHNHVRIKPQHKIGYYQIDFYLPDYNMAVEIDGDRHTKAKDNERDEKLKKACPGLSIIHIPTVNIDDNAAKLIKAINAIIRYRRDNIWSTK